MPSILENEIKEVLELLAVSTLDELNNRFPTGIASNLGRDGSSASGNAEFNAAEQRLMFGAALSITSGKGVFIGKADDGGYDFSVGDPAGNYIRWDESAGTLTIVGGLEVDEIHIPDEVTASSYHVETDGSGWVGETTANRVNAPMKWTAGGALTVTNIDITSGDLTNTELNADTVDSDQIVALAVTNAKINNLS